MDALMVVESWFGNTREIAESVARGMTEGGREVRILSVDDAPHVMPDDAKLLVVGAPTHNRGLSTSGTRGKALADGGEEGGGGVREWIGSVELRDGVRIALFDTTTSKGWLSGSAAKAAARILGRRDPRRSAEVKSFLVGGTKGPLADGQLEAAQQWGRGLAGG